ncbi:MAG: hypothetical protein SWE60_07430 [Thermodesulfobacteriota bacterium]|nr:hypothetical protein [Thermodesulfobacteriota bacterium]
MGRKIEDGLRAEKKKGVLWEKRDEPERVRSSLEPIKSGNVKGP